MRNLYPSRKAGRESLMELRWRHLDHVDDMARSGQSIDELHEKLLSGFEHFYPRLRSRCRDGVPSDETRRRIQVIQILKLVEERREELAAMPQPTAVELQAALDAAPNDYVRAVIRYFPDNIVANRS
jgi:hypothetical protein